MQEHTFKYQVTSPKGSVSRRVTAQRIGTRFQYENIQYESRENNTGRGVLMDLHSAKLALFETFLTEFRQKDTAFT